MKNNYKLTEQHLRTLKYSAAGIYVVVPIFLGLTLGIVLDSILNTRPISVLVFLFLGTIGSFYNLIALIKELKKDGRARSSHQHQGRNSL